MAYAKHLGVPFSGCHNTLYILTFHPFLLTQDQSYLMGSGWTAGASLYKGCGKAMYE